MCMAGEVQAGDLILEIGPGHGALTTALLDTGARVIAIEADGRAVATLEETFAAQLVTGQLTLIHGDIKTFDLASLALADHSFKVIANIPYYLSGLLFRTLLQTSLQPSTVVLLVQKEVAKRAVATVSKEEPVSLLSIATQVYGTVTYVKTISRGHFTPSPKVDSAIIRISDISRKHFTTISEDFFFTLLHLGFGQKRKQLLGNLCHLFDREYLQQMFTSLSIPLDIRAEALPLAQWLTLTEALSKHTAQ